MQNTDEYQNFQQRYQLMMLISYKHLLIEINNSCIRNSWTGDGGVVTRRQQDTKSSNKSLWGME